MVGFVKIVKCSYDKNTWYYDAIGLVVFIYDVVDEMLLVHHPYFVISLEPNNFYDPERGVTLYINKDDVIPWQEPKRLRS